MFKFLFFLVLLALTTLCFADNCSDCEGIIENTCNFNSVGMSESEITYAIQNGICESYYQYNCSIIVSGITTVMTDCTNGDSPTVICTVLTSCP